MQELVCSEEALSREALKLAQMLLPGDRVSLEGPLGAGKSTFAKFLLRALQIQQSPEGSPSFSIVHEYFCPKGQVAHIDYYRLKSENEFDEIGIPSYYWERNLIIISEWLSLFPSFEKQVQKSGRTWKIQLDWIPHESEKRLLKIIHPK